MMKKLMCLALFGAWMTPTLATDVGVSISIGEPGFYGQIDLGDFPRPRVIYERPVLILRSPAYVSAPPIYLRVPPGHAKQWRKYCAGYDACGRPVYFVRDDWYFNEYVPRYRHAHGHGKDHDKGNRHRDR
jgi:hypothetical protein